MRTKKSYYNSIFLVIGILLLLNILSNDYFMRLDFTEDRRYTLSQATEDIVENLLEPVTVKAYFSENLPPNVAQTRLDFKDLLLEYANLSGGSLVYEFINPNETPEKEQEAAQSGITPVMINVREKDQMKQQKAFLGAVIEMGEQQDVIPFMQPGEPMEYALTSSIKKLSVTDKPSIGLIQGHGQPSVADMQQAAQQLNILYNFEDFTLTDTTAIPSNYKAIALVAPKDTIPPGHLAKIDQYMANGGRVLLAVNKVDGNLQNSFGSAVYTGLTAWLQEKGITVENQFVIDASCASIGVQQQQGPFRFQTQIQFPYLPVISNFADHPVTKGLETVILPFASPLAFSGDTTMNYVPLAFTSDQSGTSAVPTYFDIEKEWTETDFPLQRLTVAAALEVGGIPSLVVIGDGDFAVNTREGGQPQALQPDNASLFANSIDWLSDDTGLIDLRTKGVTSRPIDQLEETTQTTLKYTNFLLPILAVIIYGFIRFQRQRSLRVKRMEISYE